MSTTSSHPRAGHRRRVGDEAIRGLCAALLPPELGGPDPVRLADDIASFLRGEPRAVGAAVRGGALGIDLVALLSSGRRLGAQSPDRREQLLRRLAARAPLAAGIDGLKSLVLLVEGAGRATPEMLAAADRTKPARPDGALDVVPSEDVPGRSAFDVVVVGSGAGGAMAARTLARAGASVVLVEEGRRHVVEDFRSRPPLERFASLYRDAGTTATVGAPPILLPIGRGVGGTTLVNSGTCYRTPEHVLRRWRDDAGLALADPPAFSPYLDEVWRTLRVGPVPLGVMGNNGRLMLDGAAKLGWRSAPLDRNAPGCGGCCQCSVGCPRNAKFGVHLNALPEACAAGARIVCDARVERIVVEGGRAVGVLARRPDGTRFELRALGAVVVAAGTTETPPLLRRSGFGGHPALGRNLTLHPAVAVAGRFDEPVKANHGVLQSAAVDEFHETCGILVEATSAPAGMGSMLLPGYGAELLRELEGADHLAALGAMVADLPSGRVFGRRRAFLRYDLARRDGRRLVQAVGIMGRLLLAAGATDVITGIPGYMRVHDEAGLDEAIAHAETRRLHVAAFHPVGTAAAGSDPGRHPVDALGALRGVDGVWVADASILPTCPEVNPQVSVMALALAVADGVARRAGGA